MVAVAFPLAAAVVAFFRGKEFPVEAFRELLLGRVPDGNHFPAEIQDLAGHRVVEVHGHAVLLHFHDGGVDDAAVGSYHRQDPAHLHQVLAQFTLDGEGGFGEVETALFVVGAVAVLRLDGKGEESAFFEAFQGFLELGDEHMHALNVVEGLFFIGAVHQLAVHGEVVCDEYYFILFDFHALQSIFENAKVGIILDMHKRASSAVAMRWFHRSMKLPVTSISRTGCVRRPFSKANPSMP